MIKNTYKLPEKTIPSLELEYHLSDIVEFRTLLLNRGIVTKNTRIERYELYLRAMLAEDEISCEKVFKGIKGKDFDKPVDRMLYLLREIHELMWILKGLKAHVPKGVDVKLREVVGGQDFAALDKNSSSRNTQYELQVSSYFCQSGYSVDVSTQTDVIAQKDKSTIFIECKRVASSTGLYKNISEARDQLNKRMPKKTLKQNYYGMLAIDVTKVAFSHNGLTFGMTEHHSRDVIQNKLTEISDRIASKNCFGKRKDMLLLRLSVHISALVIHPKTPITRFSSYGIINPKLKNRQLKGLICLQDALGVDDKGDDRITPSEKLKFKKEYVFPVGTSYKWDEQLILSFISNKTLDNRDSSDKVLELNLKGNFHEFSFMDLETVISKLDESEVKTIQQDPEMCRALLMVKLYVARYPYEDT